MPRANLPIIILGRLTLAVIMQFLKSASNWFDDSIV